MKPETKARLVKEFESKHPKPEIQHWLDKEGYPVSSDAWIRWNGALEGWLLAHTDSEMAKDVERMDFLQANPRWTIRWRIYKGSQQWGCRDDGEPWGAWCHTYRDAVDQIIRAQKQRKEDTDG